MNTTLAIEPTDENAALTGKAYLITGGSTGIGFATAELLVRDGARVFLTGRDRQLLDAARQQLGINAVALQSDASEGAGGIGPRRTRARRTTRRCFYQCWRGCS